MNVLEKLKILKEKIVKVQKLNEDLIEIHLANRKKISSLENKIEILKNGIKESADDIERIMKDLDDDS